jgi:hypothetical protein
MVPKLKEQQATRAFFCLTAAMLAAVRNASADPGDICSSGLLFTWLVKSHAGVCGHGSAHFSSQFQGRRWPCS